MKRILIIPVLCAVSLIASAQTYKNLAAISWEVAFPSDNEYISKTSWAGGRLEFRHFLNQQFSIGLGLSWNSFDEYVGTTTYKNLAGNSAVTTDMVRQIYTVPITATAHYYFTMANKNIKPYAGVGLGTQYAEQNSYFNIYLLENNNWGFVVRPEVGALFAVKDNMSILLAGSYNMATNKNDEFKTDDIKQWGVNLGLAWHF